MAPRRPEKPGPVWVPVIKARPEDVFASVAERNAISDWQQDNPRKEGEDLLEWIERGNVAASVMTLSQCQVIGQPKPEPQVERDWRDDDVDAIFGPERTPGQEG
jgi:hypothetical protein